MKSLSFKIDEEVNSSNSPEERLLLAILTRAVLDLLSLKKGQTDNDLNRWFNAPISHKFSFRWMCQYFGWEYNKKIKRINDITKKNLTIPNRTLRVRPVR